MIQLLLQALTVSLVDIDNAMFLTDQVSGLPQRKRLTTVLGLALEFFGRLLLLWLFSAIAAAQEPLFTLAGRPIRIDHLALLAAGLYLMISNGREVWAAAQQPATLLEQHTLKEPRSYGLLLAETGLMLTLLSVDTVLLVLDITTIPAQILFFFLFSAGVRLLFVDRLVELIERFPSVSLFVNGLLILIGAQLLGQALGFDQERPFNGLVLLIVIGVVGYVWWTRRQIPD